MFLKTKRYFYIMGLLLIPLVAMTAFWGLEVAFDVSTPKHYPHIFNKQKSYINSNSFVKDTDRDGYAEIFVSFNRVTQKPEHPDRLVLLDQNLNPIYEYGFEGEIFWVSLWDVNHDGVDEIIGWIRQADTAFVDIRTLKNEPVLKFPAVTPDKYSLTQNGKWNCSAEMIDFRDVDQNGTNEMIFRVSTSYGRSPRGLFAFEFPTGNLIWAYRMGAAPTYWLTADLNYDGWPEYILGTSTPENVPEPINGTQDDVAYLFVIDHLGKPLLVDSLGVKGAFVVPFLADIDQDHRNECVVIQNNFQKEAQNHPSMIYYLEPGQEKLIPMTTPLAKKYLAYAIDDFNLDGLPEVFLLDHQMVAFLYTIDPVSRHLKLNRRTSLPLQGVRANCPVLCADLDLNGEKEMVLAGMNEVYVVDAKLNVRAMLPGTRQLRFVPRGKEQPLVLSTRMDGTGCDTWRYQTNPFFYFYRIQKPLIIVPILGMLMILFILFRLGWQLLQCGEYALQAGAWIEINRKNAILRMSYEFQKLLGLRHAVTGDFAEVLGKQNALQLETALDEFFKKVNLAPAIHFSLPDGSVQPMTLEIMPVPVIFRKSNLIVIFQQQEKSVVSRLMTWLTIIRALMHNLKNPLTTAQFLLKRTQQEVEPGTPLVEKIQAIEQEVLTTKTATTHFLSFIDAWQRKPRPCDMNAMLLSIQKKMLNESPDVPLIKLNLSPDLPQTRIVHDLLEMALENVIRNAAEAVGANGNVLISTSIQNRVHESALSFQKMIQIEVLDSGPGIPPDIFNKIFSIGVTTKPDGSGIGLSVTREILQWFGGEIKIESKFGFGTEVTILLPVHN